MTSLKPTPSFVAMKRARSSDQAAMASNGGTRNGGIQLPPFLRQSKEEVGAKWLDLQQQQAERFKHGMEHDQSSPWTTDDSDIARLRNRYDDVRPWSNTRIKLKATEETCDYVNASPILLTGSKGEQRRYIACQGPTKDTVDHFWQMIWHETTDDAVIIMLTPLTESKREKCFQYYPTDPDSDPQDVELTDDDGVPQPSTLRLINLTVDDLSRSAIRTLELTGPSGRRRTVRHFHFLAWPDHGVPTQEDRLLLRTLFRQTREHSGGWDRPRIVHCSAGVGRSGTFVALEHLVEELDAGQFENMSDDPPYQPGSSMVRKPSLVPSPEDAYDNAGDGPVYKLPHRVATDPVFHTVNRLREQRMYMVQSPEQFAFLYEVLADAYRARNEDLIPRHALSPVGSPTLAADADPASPAAPEPAMKQPPTLKIAPPVRISALATAAAARPEPPASAPATTLTHPIRPAPPPSERPTGMPAPTVVTPVTASVPAGLADASPTTANAAAQPHLGASGEPSPKVVKLSRSFRNMMAGMQVGAARKFRGARITLGDENREARPATAGAAVGRPHLDLKLRARPGEDDGEGQNEKDPVEEERG